MRAVQIIREVNIMNLIQRLPDDLIRHIYETYFVCKEDCNKFLIMLESECSTRLEYQPLRQMSMRLMRSPLCVEYLVNGKDMVRSAIKYSYEHHYKKAGRHEKIFKLLDKHDSFTLSILMCLYH